MFINRRIKSSSDHTLSHQFCFPRILLVRTTFCFVSVALLYIRMLTSIFKIIRIVSQEKIYLSKVCLNWLNKPLRKLKLHACFGMLLFK